MFNRPCVCVCSHKRVIFLIDSDCSFVFFSFVCLLYDNYLKLKCNAVFCMETQCMDNFLFLANEARDLQIVMAQCHS